MRTLMLMPSHRNFILYKPVRYLSQFVNNQTVRKNKKLLGSLHVFPEGTMSIGRLDENSEGLLLLTTNGKTSAYITSGKVEKEYFVEVDGVIGLEEINRLKAGVEISVKKVKYITKPCEARLLDSDKDSFYTSQKTRHDDHGPSSWISITIREGKYRQVRKMTAVVGHPTLRLIRVRLGNLVINTMRPGDVIEVDDFDI